MSRMSAKMTKRKNEIMPHESLSIISHSVAVNPSLAPGVWRLYAWPPERSDRHDGRLNLFDYILFGVSFRLIAYDSFCRSMGSVVHAPSRKLYVYEDRFILGVTHK